jgi:hypothetical protein
LGRECGKGLVDLDSLRLIQVFFRFQHFGTVFSTFSRVFDGFPQKPFVPRLNHFNWLPPPDGFLLGPLHFPSGWWWTHRRLAGQPA